MSMGTTRMVEGEVSWSLLDSVHRIVRGRLLLFVTTLLGLLFGILAAVLAKPYYEANAVFLPPKNTDILPGGAAGASASLFLGGDESSDLYLGLLGSRTVQEDVISHLGLVSKFHAKSADRARANLIGASSFGVSKNSFITVQVKSGDPVLAADIANAYLDALYRINGAMVDSASAHRRVFFEQQLDIQKNSLAQAEFDLAKTQERTGLVFPAGEAAAGLGATAALQAQLNTAEVRLSGLLVGGTDQNPEVVQARTQVAQLRGQLERQQVDSGSNSGLTSNKRLPGLTLEYEQKEREVKLKEAVYDTLVQQYERARLSAIDPGPQLQIVDAAVIPEQKAGPNRRLIVITGLAIGFFLGLAYLLLFDPFKHLASSLRKAAQPAPR